MPRVFLGQKVVRLRSSHVSLLGLQGPTTHPDEVNIPNSDDADDCPGQGQDALSACGSVLTTSVCRNRSQP